MGAKYSNLDTRVRALEQPRNADGQGGSSQGSAKGDTQAIGALPEPAATIPKATKRTKQQRKGANRGGAGNANSSGVGPRATDLEPQRAPPTPRTANQATRPQEGAGTAGQAAAQGTAAPTANKPRANPQRTNEGPSSQAAPNPQKPHIDTGTLYVDGCPADMPSEQLVQKLMERVQALIGIRVGIQDHVVEVHPNLQKRGHRTTQRLRLTVNASTHTAIYSQRTKLSHGEKGDTDYFPPIRISLAVTSAGTTFRNAHQGVFKYLQRQRRSPSWRGTHLMAETTSGSGKWERVEIDSIVKELRDEQGEGREASN